MEMTKVFDKIEFSERKTTFRLTTNDISPEVLNNKAYSRENLLHSKFAIAGTARGFNPPPITEFARNNLYHMESFVIFDYDYSSFTERENFHSFLILYTYSGEGTLTYKNHTYTLTEGDGFLINCMDHHFYKTCGEHWEVAALHLGGPLMAPFFEQYEKNGTVIFHDPISGQFQNYLEQLLLLYSYPQLYRDWLAASCIGSMLTNILSSVNKSTSMRSDVPENIRYLIRYMEHNYTLPLTLDYLAAFANINKYYLCREFKKYTGFSPGDYLISLRINQAKTLLTTTSMPAARIGADVGIPDANNFTNLFKKKVGMTPANYRKRIYDYNSSTFPTATGKIILDGVSCPK